MVDVAIQTQAEHLRKIQVGRLPAAHVSYRPGGIPGCLVVEPYRFPSEKYESIGMMTFPIYGK